MFQVLYSPGAAKSLKRIHGETAKRIVRAVDALSEVDDPKRYIKKLKGSFGVPLYSFRVGDYRVILSLDKKVLIIFVVDVGDRRTVYRNY